MGIWAWGVVGPRMKSDVAIRGRLYFMRNGGGPEGRFSGGADRTTLYRSSGKRNLESKYGGGRGGWDERVTFHTRDRDVQEFQRVAEKKALGLYTNAVGEGGKAPETYCTGAKIERDKTTEV